MRGDVMNVWNWIDKLARGLKKVATESQQNYQQIHAYVDGHDKETLNQVGNLVHDEIKQANDKINETITNLQGNLQNVTADLTGLQSTVKDKADQSQITQLTNAIQSKVSSKDYQMSISQLTDDINAKVAKGDLISQINMEAGQTLIQSNKIYLDNSSVVFGKNSTAFIPNVAIQNLSLDKLTTGNLAIPLQDSTGNSVVLNSKGVTISSPVASTRAYGFKNMQVTIGSGQMHLEGDLRNVHTGVTSHYQLGELLPVYDSLTKLGNAVDEKDDQTVGTAFMVDTLNSGKNGNFFALARSRENNSNPPYVTGVVYNTTGEHREVGLHTFDPLYIHPYGADGYIQSTWVSWSNWNNGEKIPALTQAGSGWGGIGFPKSGQVSLFDDYGHVYQPQGGSGYTDYQHQYHL